MVDFDTTYALKITTTRSITAVKKLDDAVEKLDVTLAKVGVTVKSTSDDFRKVGADAKRHVGGRAKKAVDKLAKSASIAKLKVRSVGDELKRIGRGMASVGRKLTIGFTAPVIAAGAGAVKMAKDLNESMANVSTLMSGGVKDVQRLKTSVQDMSVATGLTTKDLSEGLFQVISAFGEGAENVKQLNAAARAGVAGRASTVESIELLSAVTKSYGDTSEEALKKVSDLAFKTNELGQTTFPELASAIGKTTPLAAALNTSQEELFGTFATLTGVTGNTAEVATQISSIYSAMLKPSKELTETVQKLGFASASSMIKEKGFRQSLIMLSGAVDGSEDALAKMLGRKEALVGALALLGGQSDEYARKLGEMQDASGATDEAYRKQTEGINAQGKAWERTKRRFEVFAQRIGDKLLPILERLFKKFEPWLEHLEGMSDATLEWWMNFVGLHAAIGPILTVVGGLAAKMGTLAAMTRAANAQTLAMTASTNAMGSSAVTNTGKVKGLSRAMKGLAAIGIISVGIDLAMVIGKLSEEHSQKQAESQDELRNAIRHARQISSRKGGASFEEKQSALARLSAAKGYAPESLKSAEGVAGTVLSTIGLAEHPAARVIKNIEQAEAEERRLRSGIQSDIRGVGGLADVQRQASVNPLAGQAMARGVERGMSGGQPIIIKTGDTSLSITAPSGDARDISREMKKVLANHDKQQIEQLRRAAQSIAAGEQ